MITDFKDIYQDIEKISEKKIEEVSEKWFKYLKEKTPEDTFLLQNRNIKGDIVEFSWDLKVRLSNDSEYAAVKSGITHAT